MKKPRDYKEEYARRTAQAAAKGVSRSQARGHPRKGERLVSMRLQRRASKKEYDPRLEQGLKQMREGRRLTSSARAIGVSPERLRRYVWQTGVVRKKGGRWIFRKDKRRRQLPIYSHGQVLTITVANYEIAAKIGRYMAAAGEFLISNDPAHLAPFMGESVADVDGRVYIFETRPNVLYRLASSSPQSFENVYRIIM